MAEWIGYPLEIFLRVHKSKTNGYHRIFFIDRVPGFPFLFGGLLKRIYLFVIPKIDLLVLLEGATEKIWKRKRETDLAGLAQDMEKWKKVADQFSCSKIVVDTNLNSEEESASLIGRAILADENFKQRFFSEIVIGEEEERSFRITPMRTAVILLKQHAYKIPCGLGAYKEFLRERRAIEKAKEDNFFAQFLPDDEYFGPILKMKRLRLVIKGSYLVDNFFSRAFSDKEKWSKICLKEIVEPLLLEFLSVHGYFPLRRFLENFYVPRSSAHGDLHFDNILRENDRIFLIDWSNYQPVSSRYFDLISFVTTKSDKSWVDLASDLAVEDRIIFGQPVSRQLVAAYCLWRVGKELRELENFCRLNNSKINKYKKILDNFCCDFKDFL